MGYCNCGLSALNQAYHDTEWGVPVHDDRRQFELLSMEVMQCGLSWELVLRKREVLRRCFEGFDFDRVATYAAADVARILATPGMVNSRRKVEAIIGNAICLQRLRDDRDRETPHG